MSRFTFILLLSLFSVPGQTAKLGIMTVGDWNGLNDDFGKLIWVSGAIDGIIAESFLTSKSGKEPWLGACLNYLKPKKAKELLDREVLKHLETPHAPLGLVLQQRLKEYCEY